MPFDLARSTHVFTPTADGGTQDVISKDGDDAQVALIRGHLRKEAEAFARGDYADPASIHGQAMPGLAILRAGAARVRVGYEEMADGARVSFTTRDPKLAGAVHDWFAAQVHGHGADARMRRQRLNGGREGVRARRSARGPSLTPATSQRVGWHLQRELALT